MARPRSTFTWIAVYAQPLNKKYHTGIAAANEQLVLALSLSLPAHIELKAKLRIFSSRTGTLQTSLEAHSRGNSNLNFKKFTLVL